MSQSRVRSALGRILCCRSSTSALVSPHDAAAAAGRAAEMGKHVRRDVCAVDDVQPGQMAEFNVGEGRNVLVLRTREGEFRATGAKCSHYGAPLVKGSYDGRDCVRCPWHGACFNVRSGDIEECPGEDGIPTFSVSVEDGRVIVSADIDVLQRSHKRAPVAFTQQVGGGHVVVVGGGPAGLGACESLRQHGYSGRISLVSAETTLPYDRTKLSKNFAVDIESIQLRDDAFFKDQKVDLHLGVTCESVDVDAHVASLSDGSKLAYDKICIATGGTPRRLDVPGIDRVSGVHYLRTIDDARAIAEDVSEHTEVAIVGSSFIGMEVAAALSKKVKTVHVIGTSKEPFAHVLGTEIGACLRRLHEEKGGVQFHLGSGVARITEGENQRVSGVGLESGETVPCDMLVVGIGMVPTAGKLVHGTGINVAKDNSIVTDASLYAGNDVYVAGDAARFPHAKLAGADTFRIEHWGFAGSAGRTAGYNMTATSPKPFDLIPFFWTMQYGLSLRYVGHARRYDDIVFDGSVEERKFVAYFCDKEEIRAVTTLGRDPVAAVAANLMKEGKMPKKGDLAVRCVTKGVTS